MRIKVFIGTLIAVIILLGASITSSSVISQMPSKNICSDVKGRESSRIPKN